MTMRGLEALDPGPPLPPALPPLRDRRFALPMPDCRRMTGGEGMKGLAEEKADASHALGPAPPPPAPAPPPSPAADVEDAEEEDADVEVGVGTCMWGRLLSPHGCHTLASGFRVAALAAAAAPAAGEGSLGPFPAARWAP